MSYFHQAMVDWINNAVQWCPDVRKTLTNCYKHAEQSKARVKVTLIFMENYHWEDQRQ